MLNLITFNISCKKSKFFYRIQLNILPLLLKAFLWQKIQLTPIFFLLFVITLFFYSYYAIGINSFSIILFIVINIAGYACFSLILLFYSH